MSPTLLKRLRALIVDDETPARRRICDLLRKDPDIDEIFEAENGVDAVAAIEGQKPDVVFLDVQMPQVDGFAVIDAVGIEKMPAVVFVTAYDRFALQAFEADAVDYLLKPYSQKRFEHALEKIKQRQQTDRPAYGPHVQALISRRATPGEVWQWLVVKTRDATRFVMASEIDWISGAGVYSNLHVQGKELIYRAPLGAIVKRLDPFRFVRIHRSHVINIRAVQQLEPTTHGEFEVVLKDGTRLYLSRHYRNDVEKLLGQSL